MSIAWQQRWVGYCDITAAVILHAFPDSLPHGVGDTGFGVASFSIEGFKSTIPNAGAIPATHWTQDPSVGGGRIIGECCHFVDLLRFLAGHSIVDARIQTLSPEAEVRSADSVAITLGFEDGSWGAINYLANGHASFPKERVEVFCAGRILQLDNFRRLRAYGWPKFHSMKLWRQDKGQKSCVRAFLGAVSNGGRAPIPLEELLEVARVSVALGEAARG